MCTVTFDKVQTNLLHVYVISTSVSDFEDKKISSKSGVRCVYIETLLGLSQGK